MPGTRGGFSLQSVNSIVKICGADIGICQFRHDPPGNGRTIVFLHDSLGCIGAWGDFPQMLCELSGCDGLIYDRRGHGISSPFEGSRKPDYHQEEANMLDALLEKMGVEKAILFGHSDGGTIALLAAALHPERVDRIISEAGHVFVENITIDGIIAAKDLYDNHEKLQQRLFKHHGAKSRRLLEMWTEDWLNTDFRDWNIEKFLPLIKCPVLVIQGENDEFGTIAQVEAIYSQIGGVAEACVLPRMGHTPHKQAREEILEKSTKFIAQLYDDLLALRRKP